MILRLLQASLVCMIWSMLSMVSGYECSGCQWIATPWVLTWVPCQFGSGLPLPGIPDPPYDEPTRIPGHVSPPQVRPAGPPGKCDKPPPPGSCEVGSLSIKAFAAGIPETTLPEITDSFVLIPANRDHDEGNDEQADCDWHRDHAGDTFLDHDLLKIRLSVSPKESADQVTIDLPTGYAYWRVIDDVTFGPANVSQLKDVLQQSGSADVYVEALPGATGQDIAIRACSGQQTASLTLVPLELLSLSPVTECRRTPGRPGSCVATTNTQHTKTSHTPGRLCRSLRRPDLYACVQ